MEQEPEVRYMRLGMDEFLNSGVRTEIKRFHSDTDFQSPALRIFR
jgi:hypothetical protein